MKVILFAPSYDTISQAVFDELTKNKVPVELINEEQLTFAKSWYHEIDEKGNVHSTVILPDGTVLNSSDITFALNRLRTFQMIHFVDLVNRSYAIMEQSALFFSFLKSLGQRLFEPIENSHFNIDDTNVWLMTEKAIEAGLPVVDIHFSTTPRKFYSSSLIPSTEEYTKAASNSTSHLLWQNHPVFLFEKNTGKKKITVAGAEIIGDYESIDKRRILKFSKLIKRNYFELIFVKTHGGDKLFNINLYPNDDSGNVINAICKNIIKRSRVTV